MGTVFMNSENRKISEPYRPSIFQLKKLKEKQ